MLQLPHVFEIADLEERREKASNLLKVRVRVRLWVRVRVRVNQRETASTLLTLTLTTLKGFTTLLHDDTAMLNMVRARVRVRVRARVRVKALAPSG